jgi:hypothetical protein
MNAGIRGGGWPRISDWILDRIPQYRRLLAELVLQNELLMQATCEVQHGRVFLDASKDPERLRIFRRFLRQPLKVIRILREGRGVANSYMKRHGVPMSVAAREVARTSAACDRMMAEIRPEDQLTVTYETFCSGPSSTLESIYRLVGLQRHSDTMLPSKNLHILGNDMRLGSDNAIKLDEKWRSELSSADLGVFERIAGQQNRTYGYGESVGSDPAFGKPLADRR